MTIPEIENGVQTTNTLSNNLGAKITKFGLSTRQKNEKVC